MYLIMSGSNCCSDNDHTYGYVLNETEANDIVVKLKAAGHIYGHEYFFVEVKEFDFDDEFVKMNSTT